MPHIRETPSPRVLPLLAGAALGTWGIRRDGFAGVASALIGIGLLARGLTGRGVRTSRLANGRTSQLTSELNPEQAQEARIDEAVEESFPASDPTAWTATGTRRVPAHDAGTWSGTGVASPEPQGLPGAP